MRPPSPPTRVIRVRDGLAVGEVGNVCVAVWRGPVTRPRFETQREALEEVISRHAKGAGFFCLIEPTAKPPDDALRRASADMVKKHEKSLHAIACVVERTGFSNAVARSALSAMAFLVGPRTIPLSVLGTVTAGATWIAPHTEVRDAAGLARAVEAIRGEMEPWTAGAS